MTRHDDHRDECHHVWGPVTSARFTGNPHRTCEHCGAVTLDLDDGPDDDDEAPGWVHLVTDGPHRADVLDLADGWPTYGAPCTWWYDDDETRGVRVSVEPDEHSTFDDAGDFFGAVSRFFDYSERDTYTVCPPTRPAGFDGRARKVRLRDGYVWWQPPADVLDRDALDTLAAWVRDRAEWGWSGVVVEILDGRDAYRRPIVRATSSLWGIDEPTGDYLRDVIGELLDDAAADMTTTTTKGNER